MHFFIYLFFDQKVPIHHVYFMSNLFKIKQYYLNIKTSHLFLCDTGFIHTKKIYMGCYSRSHGKIKILNLKFYDIFYLC